MDDKFYYRDELFQAAFRLRDEEPWVDIDENDVFHFLASSGKDYYGMVTGFAGQHLALTLYRGLKGYSTRQYFSDRFNEEAKKDPYFLCSQDCIQVSIEDIKENVPPEVLKEERAYAKRHGFRLGHKN
ncbi:MAG: hypothetical protein KBS81_01120, partial [Spirochaetales bacterium]|nr:hypothetical protein [Candidatus Physcosoma equi]